MSNSNGPFAWGFKATLGSVVATAVVGAATFGTLLVVAAVDSAIQDRKFKKEREGRKAREQEDKEVSSEG